MVIKFIHYYSKAGNADMYFKSDVIFFDLERPRDLDRLADPFITFSEVTVA